MSRILATLLALAVVVAAQTPPAKPASPPAQPPQPASLPAQPASVNADDAAATHDHVHPPAPAPVAPLPAKGTPKIACADPTWKFGSAPQMTQLKHLFPIKNEGDGTLTITQVVPTCQCTATLPKKTVLEPGESTEIDTTLNTQTFQGPLTKNISVVSNDPKSPNLTLTLTGEVLPPYYVRPKDLNLGKVVKNTDSPETEVVLTVTKAAVVQIKDIKTSHPLLHIEPAAPMEELPDGSKAFRFKVKLKSGVPVGLVRETVTFLTDAAAIPTTPVAVSAAIQGEVQIDPPTFNLGRVKKGETATRELVITKSGAADLKIESAAVVPEAPFGVEVLTDEPGRKYRVKVTLKADAPDGYHRGTVTVKTNCPGETTLQAFFYAFMGK